MREKGNNINISLNNLNVCYSDHGPEEAPIIIFIHGFPFNKSMWNLQIEALKDNYRVIAYDIRGHGSSDGGNQDFSIDLFVQDLILLMNTLKIFKAVLCGLSMGGYIALNAIKYHPERFEALVLSDTQCKADTLEIREKRINTLENIVEKGVERFADESVKNLFAGRSFTTNTQEIAAVRKMILDTSEQTLCNTLFALSTRSETCGDLSNIIVPVLIMVGEEDKITALAEAIFMNKGIKNSILHVISGSGHLPNMENASMFNERLKAFAFCLNKTTQIYL